MEIYIAICEDRHIDPYIRPFSTFKKALDFCTGFVEDEDDVEIEELTDEMTKDNWLHYATYGGEDGGSARIEKRILDLDE